MSVGSICPPIKGLTWIKGGPMPLPPPGPCVIEFWATWCPPCRQTIPHLTQLQRQLQGKVTIVGISLDEDIAKLQRFVAAEGEKIGYAIAADLAGGAQQELYLKSEARGVPHAFLLDADHRILASSHPMDPAFTSKLQAAAASAGPAPAPAPAKKAVPPVTLSFDELMTKGVKELKALLAERGVAHADCLEKGDLARRVVERCSQVTHYV
ncbi:hypothetical protein MNEG_11139 [Monoraphidium neglectum]|uniref:Thioredoxin domain-containing protein n=1 Tax=Monoraphidium neglectum TaxID=145388 RepID=A0A0D2KM56_9CHLO|nr:hypothetical protein MNEG_11139 [Monoraphidium neglectum]KIY96823.1 hypothetical protein MNEG_11139 [Monoraphidium neglectum]|eukprot:XP_013895843.1 hypothetical protein MNEG_11139 [Monoraphidium neglectum]